MFMESKESILDNIKSNFSILLDRNTLIVILVGVIVFLAWLMALPLFGPVLTSYFENMRALAIEKGRAIQLFLLFMSISSFVSGYIIDKTGKRTVFFWGAALLGSLMTVLLNWIKDIMLVIPVAAVLGIAAGVSPVALGTFFADYTAPEDRGRIIGLCLSLAIPIAYIFLVTGPIKMGAIHVDLIIIGVLYLLTIGTVVLKPKDIEISERDARRSRGAGTRQIVLYSAPIFLFYIVLGVMLSTVFPTIQDNISKELFYTIWAIPTLLGGLYGGVQLDTRGRKFPMIVGLAVTGISLAVLGVLGIKQGYVSILTLSFGYAIVTIASIIIWSDLAPMKARGIHYGLGFGLIGAAILIGMMVSGGGFGAISASKIRTYMFYSAVALFLCIPPLIIAEDALPKEIIEKRQLEEHLKRAKDKMMNQ